MDLTPFDENNENNYSIKKIFVQNLRKEKDWGVILGQNKSAFPLVWS